LDAVALRDRVLKQQEQISSRDEELERLQVQISSHDAELERLRLVIARLQRLQFGRKSEKIQRQLEQLELQLEDLEAGTAEQRQPTEKTLPPAAAVRKPARRALPEHLPREVATHIPQHTACPACGGLLSRLGEDVSEVLEYAPARFKVIRHVRPKLSCTKCDVIVQAEAPSRPIKRGLAEPGLLAHVLVSKYADHLPLYRQAEIYAREGVELQRSTLADWVGSEPTAEAAAGSVTAVCDERPQATRRRHARSGAGAGRWQNQAGALMDVCTRRSSGSRYGASGRLAHLLAGS
jgi:transposase